MLGPPVLAALSGWGPLAFCPSCHPIVGLVNVEVGSTLDLTSFFGKRFLLIELGLFLHKCFCWDLYLLLLSTGCSSESLDMWVPSGLIYWLGACWYAHKSSVFYFGCPPLCSKVLPFLPPFRGFNLYHSSVFMGPRIFLIIFLSTFKMVSKFFSC